MDFPIEISQPQTRFALPGHWTTGLKVDYEGYFVACCLLVVFLCGVVLV